MRIMYIMLNSGGYLVTGDPGVPAPDRLFDPHSSLWISDFGDRTETKTDICCMFFSKDLFNESGHDGRSELFALQKSSSRLSLKVIMNLETLRS